MKFRPLHDRVVVKRIDEEQKTKGGIIIPDTAKEKPMQGEILAVGPGARNDKGDLIPLGVEVGDRVLFGKWSGTEVKIDGQEVLIMKESDIMGVITETGAQAAVEQMIDDRTATCREVIAAMDIDEQTRAAFDRLLILATRRSA